MTLGDVIGSVGVALLLGAFALNLAKVWTSDMSAYQATNALGAGLAAYASWLIGFMPFVILEGTWCLVSVFALTRQMKQRAT